MKTVSTAVLWREMDAEELEQVYYENRPLTCDFEGDNEDMASAVIDFDRCIKRHAINKLYHQLTGEYLPKLD